MSNKEMKQSMKNTFMGIESILSRCDPQKIASSTMQRRSPKDRNRLYEKFNPKANELLKKFEESKTEEENNNIETLANNLLSELKAEMYSPTD